MNILQRGLLAVTGRAVPELGKLIESAAGGMEQAAAEVVMARSLVEQWNSHRQDTIAELKECKAIAGSGPVSVKEGMGFRELEIELEATGWRREVAFSQMEFSRWGIQQLILISRLYFLKNPLIKRGVVISSYYVFGRGVDITAQDNKPAQAAVDAFMDANKAELGMLGLIEKDQTLRTDGNLFFVFFTNQATGETTLRTIDAVEILDIISDPDDASVPQYYKREWISQTIDLEAGQTVVGKAQTAWYPALDFDPGRNRPANIAGHPVNWEAPILHVKRGGLPKWKFGCPETYAAIDWAKAYKKFLENWSAITEALARFSFQVETKGGQQAIQQFSRVLGTALGVDNSSGVGLDSNPPPNVASSFISGPGNKISAMRTSGATTEPEQGRRVLLMVAAADGLPETFYGDASTGSLATAQSLDRPTELQFLMRQELWREILQRIVGYVLRRQKGAPAGQLREAAAANQRVTIRVDFPSVLEHDIQATVEAIVAGATLNGYSPAGTIDLRTAAYLIMRELGVEDVDQVLEAMYPVATYDPEQMQDEPEPDPAPAPPVPNQEKPRMAEAIRQLIRAAERIKK